MTADNRKTGPSDSEWQIRIGNVLGAGNRQVPGRFGPARGQQCDPDAREKIGAACVVLARGQGVHLGSGCFAAVGDVAGRALAVPPTLGVSLFRAAPVAATVLPYLDGAFVSPGEQAQLVGPGGGPVRVAGFSGTALLTVAGPEMPAPGALLVTARSAIVAMHLRCVTVDGTRFGIALRMHALVEALTGVRVPMTALSRHLADWIATAGSQPRRRE